jgi:hypothetical protein
VCNKFIYYFDQTTLIFYINWQNYPLVIALPIHLFFFNKNIIFFIRNFPLFYMSRQYSKHNYIFLFLLDNCFFYILFFVKFLFYFFGLICVRFLPHILCYYVVSHYNVFDLNILFIFLKHYIL